MGLRDELSDIENRPSNQSLYSQDFSSFTAACSKSEISEQYAAFAIKITQSCYFIFSSFFVDIRLNFNIVPILKYFSDILICVSSAAHARGYIYTPVSVLFDGWYGA